MRGRRSGSTASISSRRRDNVRDWNEKWRTSRPLVRLLKPRKEGRRGGGASLQPILRHAHCPRYAAQSGAAGARDVDSVPSHVFAAAGVVADAVLIALVEEEDLRFVILHNITARIIGECFQVRQGVRVNVATGRTWREYITYLIKPKLECRGRRQPQNRVANDHPIGLLAWHWHRTKRDADPGEVQRPKRYTPKTGNFHEGRGNLARAVL